MPDPQNLPVAEQQKFAIANPVALHASLKQWRLASPGVTSSAGSGSSALWIMLGLAALAMLFATMDEFTSNSWPMIVVLSLPPLALVLNTYAFTPPRRSKRAAKTLVDHRHVLRRAMLVVPEGRPNRIVSVVPRTLYLPGARRPKGLFAPQREPRLLARHRPTSQRL
jgi:hypothetical protein